MVHCPACQLGLHQDCVEYICGEEVCDCDNPIHAQLEQLDEEEYSR